MSIQVQDGTGKNRRGKRPLLHIYPQYKIWHPIVHWEPLFTRRKHNKSPGHDLIGSKVVKLCPEIFAMSLAKIYNWGIENGKYPDDLKIAKVIALYKKGVKFDPNNYRPISLLSLFDKIFEKILCRRLVSFLEQNKILYCYQYGFRKLYSTVLALIEITDYIKRLLDEKTM